MTVVEHHTAEELQTLFRQEREARRARRIWIVWQARLGQTAPGIAQGIGLSRRAVQEWVRRYNQEGLAGLETRAGQGRQPILSEDERQLVAERVAAGPQAGDVCSLRGVDFQKFIEARFGKLMSLTSVSRVLHELGDEWLVPRPKHRKNDPAAMTAFKKSFRRAGSASQPVEIHPTPLVGVVCRSLHYWKSSLHYWKSALHDSKSAEGKSCKDPRATGASPVGGNFNRRFRPEIPTSKSSCSSRMSAASVNKGR